MQIHIRCFRWGGVSTQSDSPACHHSPRLFFSNERLKKTAAIPEAMTSEPLAKAIAYVNKRWNAACVFLKDGRVSIDNGADERAIRPTKPGAKNWLFASSEMGAHTLATFYTLIGSAMMHQIHPYDYLLDLCKRIDQPGLKAVDLVPGR